MMTVEVDAAAFKNWAERQFADQMPFAMSVALNRTAKAVQDNERQALAQHFTIRKPWVTQGITIPRFSDKRDAPMYVDVTLDPQRQFLAKFEQGGTKTGTPELPIAVPTTAIRPGFTDLPPLSLYPKNLRLADRRGVTGTLTARRHVSARGTVQMQGKQRTFVLDAASMFGVTETGVYQRFGPGKHDFRLIWAYKQSIPIPPRLQFFVTAEAVIREVWPSTFATAFHSAIATAR